MKFHALELAGAYLIVPERVEDERGYFMRTWCRDEFHRNIGDTAFVQSSQSFNRQAGRCAGCISRPRRMARRSWSAAAAAPSTT